MENKLQSRCTGCPMFTLCLGAPEKFVVSATPANLAMCSQCLIVRFYRKKIPVSKLCPEFYDSFIDHGYLTRCLDPGCSRGPNLYQRVVRIDYEERRHAK